MNEDAKRWIYWAIPIVVVVGLGVGLYYARTHRQAAVEPDAAQTAPAPAADEPPVKHPIETNVDQAQPLPALAESDSTVQDSLADTFGRALEPFLIPNDIVRRFVATVDNLPRKKTAPQRWPVKPTPGELATSGPQGLTLSEENYARYAPIVEVVQNADVGQLAAIYKHFYPLLQQAYVDLGYPDGYFNDRVIEVIDHLLATPEVPGPIALTHPSVYYQFADASLEARSAGQKVLIRMGGDNAAIVKAKLRALREELAKQGGAPPPA